MDWLTENKIPVADVAEDALDWLQTNGAWFFDGLSDLMERLIDAILWVLQTPHPLILIAVFAAITWGIQRNWKTVAFVVLGFLFILNQDYWEETMESLTLVLSACGLYGRRRADWHRRGASAPALCMGGPGLGPDADAADFRLSDPRDCVLRYRHGAGADRHGDLRVARADPVDATGHLLNP